MTTNTNKLTDGQLLFRLQDFYGAEQDALEIGDHEYAQECADIVSVIRELQERRKTDSAEPFGYYSAEVPTILEQQGYANISRDCAGEYRFPLYASPRAQGAQEAK